MTHTSTLHSPKVEAALERMLAEAERNDAAQEDAWAALHEEDRDAGAPGTDQARSQQRADAAAQIYMPISARGGRLLYSLVRSARPALTVEFGTSFGISTVFLAAAVHDNGSGHVVTTELSPAKAAAARATFAELGLDHVVTVLEGEALETLGEGTDAVDFALLDGWKDMCLPVLQLLEPRLTRGALVVADDVELDGLAPYLTYVRDRRNGYESVTFPVEDGMEISCRL